MPFSSLNSEGYFSASQKIKCEEVINVLKTELEITEENLNYTKIILSLDNDDNFPMFMRVDSLGVDVTKDAEGAKDKPCG